MNQQLIELLKNARIAKGLKQEDVAQVLGVKKNTISNYETGKSEPDIDSFITMCNIYDVDYTTAIHKAYGTKKEKTSATEEPLTEAEIEAFAVQLYQTMLEAGLVKEGQELTDAQIKALESIAYIASTFFDDSEQTFN